MKSIIILTSLLCVNAFAGAPIIWGPNTAKLLPPCIQFSNGTTQCGAAVGGSIAWGSIIGTLASQTDLQSALDAKQNSLGYTAENAANKSTGTSLGTSNVLYPSQNAVKVYADTKVERKLPVFNQYVNVNYVSGSDVTGDGSIDKPFKTIVAAMATITDATSSKPYVIALSADRQVEASRIFIKPYVSIVGVGQRTTTVDLSGLDIKPDPIHGSSDSQVSISNLYLGGAGIDWDLFSLGGPNNSVLITDNLTVDGALNISGRTGFISDALEVYNTVVFNGNAIDSASISVWGGELVSPISITNSQSVGGIFAILNNTVLDSGMTIENRPAGLNNVIFPNGVGLTTVGTVDINSYRGLPPKSTRTLSGGTTIVNYDNATMISYTPNDSADWTTVPTDVNGALDTIATGSFNTGLSINTIGNGLSVKIGSNAKSGHATCSSGTAIVSNTSVTNNSHIHVTVMTAGGTLVAAPYVSAKTASSGFTITCSHALDTSVIGYDIIEEIP